MSTRSKRLALLGTSLMLASCIGGTGKEDSLRDPVSATGISLGLQVNLPRNANDADAAATIYKDGARQPLVGGDFFMARSSVDTDGVVLKSVENLSGDYLGRVAVASASDPVWISTEYDPERAREDRWYPVDELLVDPGPNEDLVGYTEEVIFPQPLAITSSVPAQFTSRSSTIPLSWTPGDGEQMTTNAIVTCRDAGGKTYSFPRFNVLGNVDAAGTYNGLTVGTIIPNTNIINVFASLTEELATLISTAILQYYTFGIVNVKNIPLATFQVQSCDVQLTLFREKGLALPDNVAGGYAIGSTSDTVSFRFVPGV